MAMVEYHDGRSLQSLRLKRSWRSGRGKDLFGCAALGFQGFWDFRV